MKPKLILCLALVLCAISVFGFTTNDANLAFDAYNARFYVTHDGLGRYKMGTSDGGFGLWTEAEEIEMIEDAWERTHSTDCVRMITESINEFTNHFKADWTGNKFNDDIMWMTIACARGYQATSNSVFLDLARKHFRAVCVRAWDAKLGGGLWWSTDRTCKNACINGPAVIAACLLYQISGDHTFLNGAKTIYTWERKTLFDAGTGAVSDNIKSSGVLEKRAFTYNEGTFIGAANLLWKLTDDTNYFNDAMLAASFAKDTICKGGLMPDHGSGDGAGFNGILIRWLARFVKDNNLRSQFYDWMVSNANAAWSMRREDNLSWQKWDLPTPSGKLESWNCSDTVVILQVVPAEWPGGS